MAQTVIINKDNLLDEVIARFTADATLEQVDTIRDEVGATYDMLDGWGIDQGSAADTASKAMREAIADSKDGKVDVTVEIVEGWVAVLDHLHGDVDTTLGNLYQTKQRLDDVLADYDEALR